MMSTNGIGLTNLTKPGLTWKTVAKGSRSATRRTRKAVAKITMTEVEAAEKSATGTMAEGVSESEKLGVAVLGQHFAGKVEHVPIKKRRFVFRSPSPPPMTKSFSQRIETPDQFVQIDHALHVSKSKAGIDGKALEVSSEKASCNGHDFSGIEILADVACNSHEGDGILSYKDNSLVEESVRQNPSTLSVVEYISSSTGTIAVPRNDAVHEGETNKVASQKNLIFVSDKTSADECDGECAQGKAEKIAPQNASVAILDISSAEERNGMAMEAEIEKTAPLNNSITVLDKSFSGEPNVEPGDDETKSIASHIGSVSFSDKSSADECERKLDNTPYSTDDRLLWDLNLSTDAWEQPCDSGDDAPQRNVVELSEDGHTQKQCSDINNEYCNVVVAIDGCRDILVPSEISTDTNGQNAKDFQSGYDSQIEDGELREPYACWEENDMDAEEIEHVDYDSEPEDERFLSLPENNEKKAEDVDKGIVSQSGTGPKKSETFRSGDGSKIRIEETKDGRDIEKHVVCMNDSYMTGSSKGFVSKAFKRKSPLQNAVIGRRRSGLYGDSYDKEVGSEKFMGRDRSGLHVRGRSPGRGHFGCWDSFKRRDAPVYHKGSYNVGRPRPKSIVEGRGYLNGSENTASGTDGHIQRQLVNGAYRSRFRRYPEGLDRDLGGIDRSMPNESHEYSNGRFHQHRTANRSRRSNSPVFRRLHYPQTYRKSRSRSRSRSPMAWNSRNRSPNVRMDRVRLPFQKRFPADHEMGFMSPPRSRGSPQRSSRWFDDRNNGTGGDNNNNNYRGRKSPVRIFRPSQRFDSGQTVRRVNSKNHFRPLMLHRRYPDGAGGGSGCKYEGTHEDKLENRNERKHRLYDNNTDGDNIRRFRFNGEESLVANDS